MIRLMSNNLWKCDKNPQAWVDQGIDASTPVRAKGFVRVYEETQPDVIGLQEASPMMVEHILLGLAEKDIHYAALWGRDTPILYKANKFEVVENAWALYPLELPGREGEFNNSKTKSWCLAVLREKATGKYLIFVSTHLWWKSDKVQPFSTEARTYQIGLAIEEITKYQKKYNCPAILVGDLNTRYDSDPIKKAFAEGFLHAYNIATGERDETRGHHHCGNDGYGTQMPEGGMPTAIDHILVRGAAEGAVVNFLRTTPDYYWPLSDHSPVYIDFEL